MLQILANKIQNKNEIALIENGNLIEYYEDIENDDRKEGNIYIGEVKDIIDGMEAAFVDIGAEKNAFIHINDILPQENVVNDKNNNGKKEENKENKEENIKIKDLIKKNQKILVQVKKDSNDKKGARVSKHISLPGKYIVLMPNTNIITTSQKITNEKEQERLKKLVKENINSKNGCVIRTSAIKKEKEIIEEIKKLEAKWKKIEEEFNKDNEKPKLIYKTETILEKMIMDLANQKIDYIITNSKEEYEKIEKIKKENEELVGTKIELEKNDIFDKYDIKEEIKKIGNRKIWLKCGGFITIDKTEALTAIDVNTGKFTGKKDLEKTVYKVNEEATYEIAKQLKLKDIGGIVIIDYIDMHKEENKQKIQETLKKCLEKDRSKTQVEGFTKLNLMEMTRKHICSHKEQK